MFPAFSMARMIEAPSRQSSLPSVFSITFSNRIINVDLTIANIVQLKASREHAN
jgi:hypothetical protein